MDVKLITLAREYKGITQSRLAAEIDGLTQGNLSRIEKGLIGITPELLLKIARYLDFPLSFFNKCQVKTPISEFYYRKRASMSRKVLIQLEATMDIYRLIVDELLSSFDIPEFNLSQFDLESGGSPEQVARKIRQELGLPKGPIENLISVVESHGIMIIELSSPTSKFDGITLFTDSNQPIIFVNKDMPNDRKRFTIAHELGHLIMHIPFSIPPDRDEEGEANKFAGEFSMPELDCFNQLLNMGFRDLALHKRYWQMSMAFIITRANAIRAIPEQKTKYFRIELSRRGWRKKEPINVYLDQPGLLSSLVKAHMDDLNYTIDDLRELLGLSAQGYQQLLVKREKVITLKKN